MDALTSFAPLSAATTVATVYLMTTLSAAVLLLSLLDGIKEFVQEI